MQVVQKDVGKRLQVGQELIDYFSDKQKSADLEHDQTMLDKMVDGLATSWVNSSNYKVSLICRDRSVKGETLCICTGSSVSFGTMSSHCKSLEAQHISY